MGILGDDIRDLSTPVQLDDGEVRRLATKVDELERVNADLEDQIFEDDGFIQRIVELEAENARLQAENVVYAGLLRDAIGLVPICLS